MESIETNIYCLIDPCDNQPKYIGKTDNIKSRYRHHLTDVANADRKKWIADLLSKGLAPIIEMIDVVNYDEWEFWERHYISLYRSWGFNLLNKGDGGESKNGKYVWNKGKTGIYSSEQLIKMSAGQKNRDWSKHPMLGKKHTEEARKKIKEKRSLQTRFRNGVKQSESAKEKIRDKRKNQIITRESIEKRIKTMHEKFHCEKIVIQCNLEGTQIREWRSVTCAQRELGIKNISRSCNNRKKHSGGFRWQYKQG